tara:strand:- start:369 stop:719 length:351 start_codon:yes stop_codon:yes gene_type:complete
MKQELRWLIDDLVRADAKWEGDIIDLCDGKKDVLCYEWLRVHWSWLDDYLPVAITGTVHQIQYLDALYAQGSDRASLMLKDAIYLSLETSIRDAVLEYYSEEHMKAEAFAGYEAGQ